MLHNLLTNEWIFMHLVMTLLVRDEEDIIKQNILYHLQSGVDFVIATDNNSVDGTLDILREFEKQGVLHLIRETQDDYAQSIWVSRMAQLAKTRFNADWVINSDADEFWWPLSGNLMETLEHVPTEHSVVSVPRHNFVPFVKQVTPWYDNMILREVDSKNSIGDPLPPKVCHRGLAGVKVTQGNHSLDWPNDLHVYDGIPIEILHFPIRSYAQFENKIVKGGAAYERNTTLPKDVGGTWRELYKLWKNDKLGEYYEQQTWNETQLAEGLQKGLIIRDSRIKDFLELNRIT